MSSSIFSSSFVSERWITFRFGFGNRMFCHENSTTVFEWLNGCFIGSDFPGSFYDFLFVESDNRTVYRECADFVCCCEALQGLASNLTDAFSSDQTETSAFFCEMLCNTHHVTTHNDSQLIVRTLVVNIELDICEVYHMEANRSTVFCYLFCQVYNFLVLLFRLCMAERGNIQRQS